MLSQLFLIGKQFNGRTADSDSVSLGSNPGFPAKTDKSLEIATFLLFYKRLFWSVYSVFQKASFSALHKKPLFSMIPCWNVKKSSQRKADVYRLKFDVKRWPYNTLIATSGALPAIQRTSGTLSAYPRHKNKCNIVNGVFFCKSLYMREPMRAYACSV